MATPKRKSRKSRARPFCGKTVQGLRCKRPSWHTGDCYCYPQYHTNVALVWVDGMLFLRSQVRS